MVGALNGLGLGPTDRVAVLAANCHRYIEAYLGVPSAGSVLVPMNTRLAAVEHLAIISAARPQLLLTDRDPGSLADHVPRVMTVDEWDALVTESEPTALGGAGAGEDDLALLYFTSGTTGRPKGVKLTHRNLVANAFHKALACELRGSDVFLAAAPFFHVAGTAPVLSLVWLGGTLVVLPAVRRRGVSGHDRAAAGDRGHAGTDDAGGAGRRAARPTAGRDVIAPARSRRLADLHRADPAGPRDLP